jgi:hypothetical protein
VPGGHLDAIRELELAEAASLPPAAQELTYRALERLLDRHCHASDRNRSGGARHYLRGHRPDAAVGGKVLVIRTSEEETMTVNALADQYFAMWNEADADRRASLIAESWAENATFVDPSFEVTGHDDLNKLVSSAQQMFPGLAFVRIGDIDEHHTYLRWTWHLTAPDQDPVAGGTDIVLLTEDGRIAQIIGFHDFAPAH